MANGGVGATPKTIQAFSREIIQEFGLSIQDLQKNGEGAKWFNALTFTRNVSKRVDVFPYTQAGSYARWHEIGTAIKTTDLKYEYATVALKKISDSLGIEKNDFEDPDMRAQIMNEVAIKAASLENRLWRRFLDMLAAGDTDPYWTVQDGKQLFANDHSLFGQTVDNLLTGNLDALNPQPFIDALNALTQIPWTEGEYLPTDGMQFYLVAPWGLRYEAKKLISNSQVWQSNIVSENVFQNEVTPIITNQLTNQDNWYIIATRGNMRPVAHSKHKVFGNWSIVPKIAETDENVYQRDRYEWFMSAQRAIWPVGYFLMVKVIGGQS
jgi:hypothetical protein